MKHNSSNNDKVLVITTAIVSSLLFLGFYQLAYGLESAAYFDLTEEQEQAIIADLIEKLQAYANDTRNEPPYLYLTDEGRMTLSYDNLTRVTIADDIDAHFPHNYTAENGYIYRDGQVYKPDGSELFE